MSTPHPLRDELMRANRAELRHRLVEGRAVDPQALAGFTYRGTSLGLPRIAEQLSWKTFEKTFWRDPETSRLVGWNVRLQQDGLDAPSRPKLTRAGEPVTTWFYEVLPAATAPLPSSWPREFRRGLIIDYARGDNSILDGMHFIKDPLVDVGDGSGELLLGVSVVALRGLCVTTPTYFLLERAGPVSFVPARAHGRDHHSWASALLPFERRVAEQLFDAILGVDDAASSGLPAFSSLDHGAFWHAIEQRTAPHVGLGLRATVHALNAAPLVMAGLRRPLSALPRAARLECVERLAAHQGYAVRQMLATAKILACFAYFEHDAVRACLGGEDRIASLEVISCAA